MIDNLTDFQHLAGGTVARRIQQALA